MKRTKDMEPQAAPVILEAVGRRAVNEAVAAVAHHDGFASFHEGYAVLIEEVEELWGEIKVNRANRSRQRVHDEAIQVAAMAIEIAAISSMERDE